MNKIASFPDGSRAKEKKKHSVWSNFCGNFKKLTVTRCNADVYDRTNDRETSQKRDLETKERERKRERRGRTRAPLKDIGGILSAIHIRAAFTNFPRDLR